MYKIKILPNRHLTTHLFCKHALRSSLECEIGTAVEPFREKNYNVKRPVIKSVRECIICLFSLFLNIYFLLQSTQCRSNAFSRLAQRSVSSAISSFVLLNFKSLRATGWLENAKIASITTDNVCFIWNLYTKINYKNRKLILVIKWRYEWNNRRAHFCMAGLRPPYNVRVGYSIHTFIKRPKLTFNS